MTDKVLDGPLVTSLAAFSDDSVIRESQQHSRAKVNSSWAAIADALRSGRSGYHMSACAVALVCELPMNFVCGLGRGSRARLFNSPCAGIARSLGILYRGQHEAVLDTKA